MKNVLLPAIPVLMMGCDFTHEQPVFLEGGRPCPTESRTPVAGSTPFADPSELVDGFNDHGAFNVDFGPNDFDLPSTVALSDVIELRLSNSWTAEHVVYGPPAMARCPSAGDRIEVHGELLLESSKGLTYAVPALLSGPTGDVGDAALVLWSADVDDGREALPNPLLELPAPYQDVADSHPNDGPGYDKLGVLLHTEDDLGGRLDDGAVIHLSAYGDDGGASGFLVGSLTW